MPESEDSQGEQSQWGEVAMVTTDLENRIKILAQWIYEASHLVVFTGAGISTESGLPDFRGPDGL